MKEIEDKFRFDVGRWVIRSTDLERNEIPDDKKYCISQRFWNIDAEKTYINGIDNHTEKEHHAQYKLIDYETLGGRSKTVKEAEIRNNWFFTSPPEDLKEGGQE